VIFAVDSHAPDRLQIKMVAVGPPNPPFLLLQVLLGSIKVIDNLSSRNDCRQLLETHSCWGGLLPQTGILRALEQYNYSSLNAQSQARLGFAGVFNGTLVLPEATPHRAAKAKRQIPILDIRLGSSKRIGDSCTVEIHHNQMTVVKCISFLSA
jgi:hypothetical protein